MLTVLLRKEWRELVRTHKLTVMVAVFLFLGLISPITAKALPEILKSAAGDMVVMLPAPTAMSAVDQFLKNLTQVGLLVVVLIAMGSVAGERERGTAATILCKPVSRGAFIGSKFIAYGLTLSAGMALGGGACYYYTVVLLGDLDGYGFAAGVALMMVYLLVLLSLTLFSSALLKSPLAAGALALGISLSMSLVGVVPEVGEFLPGMLLTWARASAAGVGEPAWGALATSGALIALLGVAASTVFERHEL